MVGSNYCNDNNTESWIIVIILHSVPNIPLSAIDVTPIYTNSTGHLKKLITEFKAIVS